MPSDGGLFLILRKNPPALDAWQGSTEVKEARIQKEEWWGGAFAPDTLVLNSLF
jgi:hypothetical protein